MKICSNCKKPKALHHFLEHKNTADKLGSYCAECRTEYNQRYIEENKTRLKENRAEWGKKNRQEENKKKREYRARKKIVKKINESLMKEGKEPLNQKEAMRNLKESGITTYERAAASLKAS